MSERTAVGIANELQAVADDLAEAFHADEYDLIGSEWVKDSRGGSTEIETVVERGWCSLEAAGTAGRVTSAGTIVLSTAPYVVELPGDSIMTGAHRIRIGRRNPATGDVEGRMFTPTAEPKLGGMMDLFKVAEVKTA